eukprot:CAMPEP_0170176628 /NCGR_PEP_ID=MMETSP0040_2-20121228/9459_1 /TAXON_ID=641309 /ORGANISM="Lotharella oceanica, Strain CCMP622" /LENGTH=358 /DNA_ID=CAMNT_0010419003 /DNA_START=169 /DNA_END=1245 /DNA_ORIENTATION=+
MTSGWLQQHRPCSPLLSPIVSAHLSSLLPIRSGSHGNGGMGRAGYPCFGEGIGEGTPAVIASITVVEFNPVHLRDHAAGAAATREEVVEYGVLTATAVLSDALASPELHPGDTDEEDEDNLADHAKDIEEEYTAQEPEDLMQDEESGEEANIISPVGPWVPIAAWILNVRVSSYSSEGKAPAAAGHEARRHRVLEAPEQVGRPVPVFRLATSRAHGGLLDGNGVRNLLCWRVVYWLAVGVVPLKGRALCLHRLGLDYTRRGSDGDHRLSVAIAVQARLRWNRPARVRLAFYERLVVGLSVGDRRVAGHGSGFAESILRLSLSTFVVLVTLELICLCHFHMFGHHVMHVDAQLSLFVLL